MNFFGEVLANLLIVRVFIQYEEAFGGMSFVAFRGHMLRHDHCLYDVWVCVTIYGNNWYCYHWTSYVNPISPIVKTLCEAFLRPWHTTNLYSNVWRLIDSEFWILYSTLVKVYCDSEGTTRHGLLPILLRTSQLYLVFSGAFCVLSSILICICTICWVLNHLSRWISNE